MTDITLADLPHGHLIQMPKTATSSLTRYLGIPHLHVPARDIRSDKPLIGVARPAAAWTRSFAQHIQDWTEESEYAATAVAALSCPTIADGLASLAGVDLPDPLDPRWACRVTTPDPGWPRSRAETFFGPMLQAQDSAYEAHYTWWYCDTQGRCLVDWWLPWHELQHLRVRANTARCRQRLGLTKPCLACTR